MSYEPKLHLTLVLCCLLLPTSVAGPAPPLDASPSSGPQAVAPGPRPATLHVTPEYIPIGMTYTGATVRVEADVPAGYEAAIRVMGKAETLEMKQKGKVGGLLWMSVGETTFEAVPIVYFLLTTAPLAGAAPAAVLREWALGYAALASRAGWAASLSPELIKLKEQEGCFLVGEGRLLRSAGAGGGATDRLTGAIRLAARAPAGEYMVDLFGFHAGRAVHLGSTSLRLEHTGLARVLRSAALQHGLLYGGVANVVAVLAGLATGFVFQRRRGKRK